MYKFLLLVILASCTLSGCVPAIFVAAGGAAVEASKDRSVGVAVDDFKIATAIKTKLAKESVRKLYTKIHVEVLEGKVLYTGEVADDEMVMKAVELAWEQDGVKEVVSELKVSDKSDTFDLGQYARDTLITSQIKSKIFVNRDIKFTNYTIITSQDIVYIFGIARSEEELERVAGIAAATKGVKKVVSHVTIKEVTLKHTGYSGE